MPLTASQLTSIHRQIGDVVAGAYDVPDDRLQELYDEHDSSFDATLLAAAYERLAILSNEVDVTDGNNLITERRQQRFNNLMKLIERLEAKTGTAGGVLTVGRIRLNIDTRADE